MGMFATTGKAKLQLKQANSFDSARCSNLKLGMALIELFCCSDIRQNSEVQLGQARICNRFSIFVAFICK